MSDPPRDQPAATGTVAALDAVALPQGSTIEPAADLRTKSAGRILIGGAPLTITRLSPGGAKLVRRWFAGESIGPDTKHQALARRLTRSGMAHLRFAPHGVPSEPRTAADPLTVVIPVKDDQRGLDETLTGLLDPATVGSRGDSGELTVLVVDDGSNPAMTVDPERATLIRRGVAAGPGQARQLGLATTRSETVAFVDAGVVASAADLRRLAAVLRDPAVVAVAPRVESIDEPHLVARFDRHRSPLDLGPGESLVGSGRLVPYVPTACLVARVAEVQRVGGFDPALRYGEDVDLIWRLGAVGVVRYQPAVSVYHPARPTVRAMAAQRLSYGSAAAPLARRHGDAVSPTRISPWSLLVFALAMAGRPFLTVATTIGTALALRPKIKPLPDLTAEAFLLTARGHWYGSLSVLTAMVRAWAPLVALAALVLPSQRRRLLGTVAVAFARRLLDGPRRPTEAAVDLGLGAIDDLSYCAGVWRGAIEQRSAKALYPALTNWPRPKTKNRP